MRKIYKQQIKELQQRQEQAEKHCIQIVDVLHTLHTQLRKVLPTVEKAEENIKQAFFQGTIVCNTYNYHADMYYWLCWNNSDYFDGDITFEQYVTEIFNHAVFLPIIEERDSAGAQFRRCEYIRDLERYFQNNPRHDSR